MKHVIARAAQALAVCALFASAAQATELKVTAREAGIMTAAAPEEVKPGANTGIVPPDFKAAPQFVVAAVITVGDAPVWIGKWRGHEPFDTKEACETFINSDDTALKESNDGLEAQAKARFHPDAKVGVSCLADQSAK